jgi:hypothetical protein
VGIHRFISTSIGKADMFFQLRHKINARLKKVFAPVMVTRLIKMSKLQERDVNILQDMRLPIGLLEKISGDDAEVEKTYGRSGKEEFDHDEHIPAYQQTILRQGHIPSFCPQCGNALRSNQSFCVFVNLYDQPIFYRFNCCTEVFLIVGRSPQIKLGVYVPKYKLVVSFIDYVRTPHNEVYYGKQVFESWVSVLWECVRRNRRLFNNYIDSKKARKSVGLCCQLCSVLLMMQI